VEPIEFQNLALRLAANSSAAELRTAISRAYYAVFLLAYQFIRELGFSVGQGSQAHGEIRNRLGNSGDVEVQRVGSQLSDLHNKRIRADYHLDRVDVENQKTVQAVVQQSGKLIQILENHRKDATKSQLVKDAIKNWELKIKNPQANP
jgi:hypothetical protein